MEVIGVAAAYTGIFVIFECVYRALRLRPELTRRYVHLFSGLLAALLPLWLSRAEIIGLAAFFVAVLIISRQLMVLRSVHATERLSWGEAFFPAGVGLAAFMYLPHTPQVYYLSMLVLALSDPLANWLGGSVKSRQLLFGKTLVGSTAFFFSSLAIALAFVEPGHALLVACCATAAEALGPYGSDNLTIIPAAGLPLLLI